MTKSLLTAIGLVLFTGIISAQRNITDSILFQGYQRLYITHLPAGYTGNDSVPAVFVLHGGGGTAKGMISFTEFDLVSDTAGFIAVFPQGAVPASTGGYTWADGRGTPADSAGIDDVAFISALTDQLINDYRINRSKIYTCGMSNGGFMSQRLAVELNARIAAVASVGSTIDSSQVSVYQPPAPMPVMLINGDSDPFVPFNGGPIKGGQGYAISSFDLFNFWVLKNNCSGPADSVQLPDIVTTESSTITKYYNDHCDCNSEVVLYKVIGGGHTWPGVPGFLYELIAGQTNEDIHASVEIWLFFKKFVNSGTTGISSYTSPFRIYPNPADGFINIEFSDASGNALKLADATGKILIQKTNLYSDVTVDLSGLRTGIYFLILQSGKKYYSARIIKNN